MLRKLRLRQKDGFLTKKNMKVIKRKIMIRKRKKKLNEPLQHFCKTALPQHLIVWHGHHIFDQKVIYSAICKLFVSY